MHLKRPIVHWLIGLQSLLFGSVAEMTRAATLALGIAFLCCAVMTPRCSAADPAFVGIVALLEDSDVSEVVGLTEDQTFQLERLIQSRESAAVELAIQAKQLTPEERGRRQLLFVADSERQGLAILSETQRRTLARLRLQREGLQSLLRDEIASKVNLSDEQRRQVQSILAERDQQLNNTESSNKKKIIRSVFEKRLQKVLDDSQQQAWATFVRDDGSRETSGGDASVDAATSPEASRRTIGPASSTAGGLPANADGKLQFNFEYAPWKTVLEWFADQAKLSLVMDSPPPGSFNLSEPRAYSPEEALDVINSVLLTKGYTLVRRESMLMVINLEDGIPPNLVTTVPVQELDRRGEFELVSTLFRMGDIEPEVAEQEIAKLVGPQGDLKVLGAAKQLFVTETAGRLRTIRDVLQAMDPAAANQQRVSTFQLKHIVPDEAFNVLRQMLGLPDDMNSSADGSLRMATDVLGQRIMVTGPPDTVEQIGQILELVDVPMPQANSTPGGILASPQLVVYPIVSADSDSALQVLQTLLTDEDVRLAIDPKTGNLVALALPSQHALIRATLQQMQQGGQTIEVIRLNYVDPQVAVLAINQLFGAGEEGNEDAPKVNADVTTGQLLVRGSQSQIDQIRAMLDKMGESQEFVPIGQGTASNVRVLPLGATDAKSILGQLEQIWPSVRPNRIRTVVPSAVIRSVRPASAFDARSGPDDTNGNTTGGNPDAGAESDASPKANSKSNLPNPTQPARGVPSEIEPDVEFEPTDGLRRSIESGVGQLHGEQRRHATELPAGSLMAQAAIDVPLGTSLGLDALLGEGATQKLTPRADIDMTPLDEDDEPGADIVVAIGESGLIIASRDGRALDEFEQLVTSLSGTPSARDFAVFYLKHATAESATQILNSVLNGEAQDNGGGAGGGLLDLAGLGGGGGDLMGSLLGLGGGGESTGGLSASGAFSIVPEPRLNLLVVQANAADMQLIEQLLEIVDQRGSPELVQTTPEPRLIPVHHTSAEQIANVVRGVFASQLASGPGQQRQPSPEDFIRALRGGRGGGGRGGESAQDQQKLTVEVDARGNQLVVAAPDDLFRQIVALVRQLDQADPDSAEMTRVLTLDRANPELVRRALAVIVGSTSNSQPSQNSSSIGQPGGTARPAGGAAGQSPSGAGRGGPQNMQQQIEMFRALRGAGQQAGGRGGNTGRGRGGGGRGGGGRGGGGRGGGGRGGDAGRGRR